MKLSQVVYWNMTPEEAQAYQLCFTWLRLCIEILPDYSHRHLPRRGDPRKTLLFRHCWKLRKETKNILKEQDYEIYIRAQLEVMKNIRINGLLPRIDPVILTGEKAWKRWLLWKNRYDRLKKSVSVSKGDSITVPTYVIVQQLENTCSFLREIFGDHPTLEEIKTSKETNELQQWVALGKVSPYYLLLSPLCRKLFPGMDFGDYFATTDFDLYKKNCTMELVECAKKIYPTEFSI